MSVCFRKLILSLLPIFYKFQVLVIIKFLMKMVQSPQLKKCVEQEHTADLRRKQDANMHLLCSLPVVALESLSLDILFWIQALRTSWPSAPAGDRQAPQELLGPYCTCVGIIKPIKLDCHI